MNTWIILILALSLGQLIWWWTRNMTTTLLVMAIVLALRSPWFWIAVAPLSLWRLNQWFLHSSRPWRRVHFPMMQVHAVAAGIEQVEAQEENREWDIRNVLFRMVAAAHPDWSSAKSLLFIAQEIAKMQTLHDRPLVKQYIFKKHKPQDEAKLDQYLDDIQAKLNMTDNVVLTRTIIAGLIEEKCGKEHKGEYLYAMFTGKAI